MAFIEINRERVELRGEMAVAASQIVTIIGAGFLAVETHKAMVQVPTAEGFFEGYVEGISRDGCTVRLIGVRKYIPCQHEERHRIDVKEVGKLSVGIERVTYKVWEQKKKTAKVQ